MRSVTLDNFTMSILELENITKRFPGVIALDRVSFSLEPGEIHALVGENGAGKSTLINIISGVLSADDGELRWQSRSISTGSPRYARQLGIAVVHQEADMFGELTVAENIALPAGLPLYHGGWVKWRVIRSSAHRHLEIVGMTDQMCSRPAHTLSAGQRQLVAIATAISQQPRILLLDEPTASLTTSETKQLHACIRALAAQGTGVIYISHRINEVFDVADRVTVLRDGQRVWTRPIESLNRKQVVSAMVGRNIEQSHRRSSSEFGEQALEVEGFSDPHGRFHDATFTVRFGEIVGLYGMVGAGRSELAQSLVGLRPSGHGTTKLRGKITHLRKPQDARMEHVAYVPEDRLTQGIFAPLSVRDNVCAAMLRDLSQMGFTNRDAEQSLTKKTINRLQIVLSDLEQSVQTLSGGNQQKTVLGRWLATNPDLLILDEPTRGVDVGAKAEIHKIITELASQGKAILLISSDLPEIMAMSDRIFVMRDGSIVAEFEGSNSTEEEIVSAALSGHRVGVGLPSNSSDMTPMSQNTTEHSSQQDESASQALPTERSRIKSRWLSIVREAGLFIALLVIAGILALTTPHFATPSNLAKILSNVALVTIAGVGMTAVIVAGGLDISVGSVLAVASACSALAMKAGAPTLVGLGIAIGVGAGMCALNGIISALTGVHTIVVTLGTLSVYKWLFLTILGGNWIREMPSNLRQLALGSFCGVTGIIWFALGIILIGHVLMRYHILGRYLYATGGNPNLAATIGIRRRAMTVFAFAFCGMTVGLAAILWAAEYNTIQSNLGEGFELQVIAAAVIGGANIAGGAGSVLGTATASLLIGTIYNGMVMFNIHSDWQRAVFGVLIVVAVLLDKLLRRLGDANEN